MVSITYESDQEMIHFSSTQDVKNKKSLSHFVFIPFWKQTAKWRKSGVFVYICTLLKVNCFTFVSPFFPN